MTSSLHFIQAPLFVLTIFTCLVYSDARAQVRYEIPLTIQAGLPSIEANLPNQDTPLRFVFDTGADINVIEKQVAKRLILGGISSESPGKILVNGTMREDIITLSSVKFGDFTIPKLELASVNFNSPHTAPDRYIDGILGQEFLHDFDVTLDAPAQKLVLETPVADSKRFEGSGCFANAIGWFRSLSEPLGIYVDVLLPHKDQEGQFVRVHAFVDTGAAFTILNWAAAKAIGLMPGDIALVKSKNGVRGLDPNHRTETYYYQMPALTLGTSQIGPLKVIISDVPGFDLHSMEGKPAVLLGIDALKQQRLTISRGAGRICFGDKVVSQ